MGRENSGYLVELEDGRIGRTFHIKGLVNGKLPVYLCEEKKEYGGEDEKHPKFSICAKFATTAILVDPKKVKSNGMID